MAEVLSLRALNRATLDRQLLLRKSTMSALEAVRHLYGLQAQAPFPPYYALWARLEGFRPEQLSELILDRSVVRIACMRGTVHLLTADDALSLRALTQVILDTDLRMNTQYTPTILGMDLDALAEAGRKALADRPLTNTALGEAMVQSWPDRDPRGMAHALRGKLPLVQVPPRGIWGKAGQPTYSTVDDWLGRPLETDPSPSDMIRRYLAAFGPASVMDVQAWSGLTRLGEVMERLRPELVTFRNGDGKELFDLPDAPRPDPDTPVAPRLIGQFEQTVLSYADRSRIISDEHRKRVITQNGLVKGLLLLNGFANGFWEITQERKRATLSIEPFVHLTKSDVGGLEKAGAQLLAFAAAKAESVEIRFAPVE